MELFQIFGVAARLLMKVPLYFIALAKILNFSGGKFSELGQEFWQSSQENSSFEKVVLAHNSILFRRKTRDQNF